MSAKKQSRFKKCCRSLLKNTVAFVLSLFLIFIFPIGLMCLIPFLIYRQVVIKLAKVFRKDLGKILSTRSALTAFEKLYEHPTITLVPGVVVEGQVKLEDVSDVFKKQAWELVDPGTGELKYPELRQNISYWMGFPFWRYVNFNPEDNIKFYEGNSTTSSETARNILRELSFKPFSKDLPLWEIIILPNYIPDPTPTISPEEGLTYSLIIFRCHHSLGDGYSLMRLTQQLSNHAYIPPLPAPAKTVKRPLRLQNVWLFIRMPYEVSRMLLASRNASKGKLWPENTIKVNKSDLSQSLSSKESAAFSLSLTKELKVHYGVSATSVLFSGILGALRNTMFQDGSPEKVIVGFSLPLEGHSDKLRNYVAAVFTPLPLSEKDPLLRLQKIHRRVELARRSSLPVMSSVFQMISGSMPRWALNLGYRLSKRREFVVVSNVAGPQEQTDFCGYPIKDFVFSSGLAVNTKYLAILILSGWGFARLRIAGDSKVLKSDEVAEMFTQIFLDELETLKDLKQIIKNGSTLEEIV